MVVPENGWLSQNRIFLNGNMVVNGCWGTKFSDKAIFLQAFALHFSALQVPVPGLKGGQVGDDQMDAHVKFVAPNPGPNLRWHSCAEKNNH